MRRLLAILILLCAWSANAAIWYVSQSGNGAQSGADTNNCWSLSNFNDSAFSHGAHGIVVSAGDTVLFSGDLNPAVAISWSQVTYGFTNSGRIISAAGSGSATTGNGLANECIYAANFSGLHDVTIDGAGAMPGSGLQCTNNGSGLANQVAVKMLYCDGISNLVVKNLVFRDGYIHTNQLDTLIDEGIEGGVVSAQMFGTWTITNCLFTNVCWAIHVSQGGGSTNVLNVWSNTLTHYDHGVAIAFTAGQPLVCDVARNDFGLTANWDSGYGPGDTITNRYHHDGIHYFGDQGNTVYFHIGQNVFHQDWGFRNTGYIFIEGISGSGAPNFIIENNAFIQFHNGYAMNNGCINFVQNNWKVFNNTFIEDDTVLNPYGVSISGTNNLFVNNIVSGCATFLEVNNPSQFSAISNNVYADFVASGNYPWYYNGSHYGPPPTTGYPLWASAAGELNGFYTNSALLNSDGSLQTNSPALAVGANLTALGFTNDIQGITRTAPWDVGAFKGSNTNACISPSVSMQPGNQTVVVGNTATFTVTATGTPSLTYQWNWYGTNVTGATSTSWTTPATLLANNNSLVYVSVNNACGGTQSSTVSLYVMPVQSNPHVQITGSVKITGAGSLH